MKLNDALPFHCSTSGPIRVLAAVFLISFISATGSWAGPDDPIARVNGVTLYQSDLSRAVEATMARKLSSLSSEASNSKFHELSIDKVKALDRLVDIELLYQESLKHRFRGLVEESGERYQDIVRDLGGENKLASALQCNDISAEQFQKSIFRNLSIKRLLNAEVYSKIEVSEEEARAYYERKQDRFREPGSVRVSQILIKAPSNRDDKEWHLAQDRALKIYRDAATGADFVSLARRHSEDPISANAGGDLGSVQNANGPAIFDTVIFSMKEGTVTKPIPSHQGFHIFKVNAISPPKIKQFEEVQDSITTSIRRKRAREMIARFLSDLRGKAEIEILINNDQGPEAESR